MVENVNHVGEVKGLIVESTLAEVTGPSIIIIQLVMGLSLFKGIETLAIASILGETAKW